MKKIVALVLSLVMVLGLATTAFADTTSTTLKGTDGYEIYQNTAVVTAPSVSKVDITKTVTGNVTVTTGEKTEVTYTATTYAAKDIYGTPVSFAEVDASAADYKLVKDGAVVAFLKLGVAPTTKKVATAVVEAKDAADQVCGDYKADYVVVDGKNYAATGADWAIYNGKFVNYDSNTVVGTVAHTYVDAAYSTVDKSVTSVKCSACKATWTVLTAKQVAGMAPAAYTTATTASGTFFIPTGAVATTPAGDKVESAETFDAGIAMYVGMSVMAAAGSAVVLKKKD